ncbi:type II toxin-antitoxin system PemK/MazF family toxin (plasmid) [Lactobacillus sp. PV037]|uniref:type II toxin-antitoxin system PemK/MazF family toxin n=1 Tax=Lactobacillus sp. PV037 TaxID=2594496 RepID=UPI00223EA6C1|nr:type II toxin-antitoxin system PemK/MazF family toxin [Lactobacillus sp. PV037]QNQ82938.1 type II toxin-antitoxin system PemK/MazF family toxin [Lactobacillus sp. PV037]
MIFPRKGDIIIVDAEPHAGHEMGGHDPSSNNIRRHYVVMSTTSYNEATKLFLGLPITTANHSNNPKYMPLLLNGMNGTGVKGYIVLWQLQNFDYVARHGKIVNHLDQKTIDLLQRYVDDMVGR